ncbi:uncharacterized protein LOC119734308 [Patiria miniata]|uniref:DUF4806 domain-containing protein n=1 Tax=Patiria miniata TaxID=46514 RepID=A0A914AI34_PATMI|nr:uncharacterized protein LOC119734308 [Patiria miniata]
MGSFQVNVLLRLDKLQACQEEQMSLLRTLMAQKQSTQESGIPDGDVEPFDRPMDNQEEYQAIEAKLKDDQFRKKMIRYLSLLGGHDVNQSVRRVLRKIGTNQLWSSFSLLGRKGKLSLKDGSFFLVIMKACMRNHPNSKEVEIEKALGEYLKRTPNLPGGKNYKVHQKPGNDVAGPSEDPSEDKNGDQDDQ